MANSWFQFKQFKINQDRCAMKISTDAVMLGALVEGQDAVQVLEIGAGTGVISLMLAQRLPMAKIQAVEIDPDAASQCSENFDESPFSARLMVHQVAIQDFDSQTTFDLIVSNPPYFPDHLKPQDAIRQQALHTDSLSFFELAKSVVGNLSESGDFWLILPSRQMEDFEKIASELGLKAWKKIFLADRPGKQVYREIVAFSLSNKAYKTEKIELKSEKGVYTNAYQELLAEFFLDF
ncbi:tRNA1(Val) (adenine(37)-N6)-methyltransferase [Algoriphagus namhaensis]|uniref:tRNA1(Val) (adenine(37)-N6)-methyltransferase n=1 Tax=Algoriphagus namhaensis TaxID=915353 RepID=A0ABV8ALW6_9BACT